MVKFTILTNDSVRKRGLLAEHGLSILIETGKEQVLLDTGQTDVFLHNAKFLGISVEEIDYLMLSHGHYDHVDGLLNFCLKNKKAQIYANQNIFLSKQKETKKNGKIEYSNAGVSWNKNKINDFIGRFVFNDRYLEINDRLYISGEIPMTVDFEEEPKDFAIKHELGYEKDIMADEQMLIINEGKGIHIFLGCGHRGVANSIVYAKKLFPGKKIISLVGGMHLENVSQERLKNTMEFLLEARIDNLVPLHCTGFETTSEMKRIFGDKCKICSTGDAVELK
ncbi:MAG: MBL fold metallo-hydrolase [Deltaproteobacteria bacterium]